MRINLTSADRSELLDALQNIHTLFSMGGHETDVFPIVHVYVRYITGEFDPEDSSADPYHVRYLQEALAFIEAAKVK